MGRPRPAQLCGGGSVAHRRGPWPALLRGVALALLLLPADVSARQSTSLPQDQAIECPSPCSGPLPCRICALKLELYRDWMEVVDEGVDRFPLPAPLVRRLAAHFPLLDLGVVEVGMTRKQVADGLTDCTRIYLADPSTIQQLQAGLLPPGAYLELFLHELIHVEQCILIGGRDAYALRWFGDLGVGALALLRSGGGWTGLHGAMPMEAEAASRAAVLVQEVAAEGERQDP